MKVQRRIHPLLLVVQIVLVLLLVVRCHSNKETTDSSKQKDSAFVFTTPKVLDMESCIDAHFEFHPDELILKDSTGLLSLSDIADDVEYVLLKASNGKKEIYFDRVKHIFLSQNYIFVQLVDNVVQYDRQGNLIRTIGRQGAGPGEYNWVFEMAVDELQKKLFVSCSGKINVYDFEGKFIRAIKSTYDNKFIPLDSNYFAAEVPNLWHDVKDRLVILDKEGKVEKRFPRHRLFPHTDFVLVSSEDTKVPRLSRFGDVVYFNERYNDTIFEIKNKELQMRYFMDWGKYAHKMEYFYEQKKYDLKFKEALIKTELSGPSDFFDQGDKLLQYALIHNYLDHPDLAKIYYDSALVFSLKKLKQDPESATNYIQIGYAYAGLNNSLKAIEAAKKAVKLSTDVLSKDDILIELAEIYIMCGDYNNGFRQINDLLKSPSSFSVKMLMLDPVWKPILNKPELKKLLNDYSANKNI